MSIIQPQVRKFEYSDELTWSDSPLKRTRLLVELD